jgi:RNA polymerase sigma factor (sigma-70 family)
MTHTDPASGTSGTMATRAGALFAAYRGGDERSMAELVSLVTPILWHTARGQRLDPVAAEDVVQTAWLSLVRSADSVADPQAVLQWLIVSVRRESWRVVRGQDRVEPTEFESDSIAAPRTEEPEPRALRSDGDRRLWEHLSRLSERCQQLLRVIAFADRPDYAAVAEALGMPIGSIGPTRGRCLAKLRAALTTDPGWEMS